MKDLKKFIKTTIREFLNESYDGRFTDEYDFSKHNFNIGDCGIYAISLHRLYGYPLYAIRGKFLEPEWGGKREWDYEYCHIMIKLPNGNYMDSDGEQTKQEMISGAAFSEDIKKVEVVQITEEDAINMFYYEGQEKDIQRVTKYIMREQINRVKKWKQLLNEQQSNNYKEIEFVCHNSDSKTSSDKTSQLNLYNDLKKLQKETGYKILPYMQDFSDGKHIELSLAVVILDKPKEKQLEQTIMQLANKHGIKFDLYGEKNDKQIDGLIRGDLYDNMI